MKKIVFSIIFIFSILFSCAQAPVFEWAKSMGSWSDDDGYSIAVDAFGDIYTTGRFKQTADFNPGPGIFNLTSDSVNTYDIFISKLDASGNFLWAKKLGGTLDDYGQSIAVDTFGSVYTTGTFNGTADFDPGGSIFNLTSSGAGNIFISKLDALGNFIWAKNIGGASYDAGYSITVNTSGNVYTTGYFSGTADFDPGVGIYNLISDSVGTSDIFISKLDILGNFLWAKNIGGKLDDDGNAIALDTAGNIYITGDFQGTADFEPTAVIFNLTSKGYQDIFILKLDEFGNFVWAKNMGGISVDYGKAITLDANCNVYTTGVFSGTADFDPGVGIVNLTYAGGSNDVFISKLNSAGNYLWAKKIGGASNDIGSSIALDISDNVYITGGFDGAADFDPNSGTFNLIPAGYGDSFISKLDSAGNFVWAENIGGTYDDSGYSIALDLLGNVYTAGVFDGIADFDPGAGTFDLTPAGSYDIFVHKMSQTPTGINEILNESSILLYPNPANNYIDIETNLKVYSLSVFDVMGKLIYKEKTAQSKTRINISNFSNGIYFLQLANGDKVISKKFIKE